MSHHPDRDPSRPHDPETVCDHRARGGSPEAAGSLRCDCPEPAPPLDASHPPQRWRAGMILPPAAEISAPNEPIQAEHGLEIVTVVLMLPCVQAFGGTLLALIVGRLVGLF